MFDCAGGSHGGITSVDLQGIDSGEILETVYARWAPMIPVSASLRLCTTYDAGAARRAKRRMSTHWLECRLTWSATARSGIIAGVDCSIRRGTVADARAAADLWLRARKGAVGAIPSPVHGDDDVRAWFASHVVTATEFWLAIDRAGTPVGILVLDGEWVDQLYVEPTMTGQGIGAQLLSFAKRRRPRRLRLWTFASNIGAQRFYEYHGFAETMRTDGRDNEERAPDILYAWPGDG